MKIIQEKDNNRDTTVQRITSQFEETIQEKERVIRGKEMIIQAKEDVIQGSSNSIEELERRIVAHRQILHQTTIDMLKREIAIMAHIQHPNLVRFVAAVVDDEVERESYPNYSI